MKPVQNDDKTWDVVNSAGEVVSTGHKNRNEARDRAKVLLAEENEKLAAAAAGKPAEAAPAAKEKAPKPAKEKAPKPEPTPAPTGTAEGQDGQLEVVELTPAGLFSLLQKVQAKMEKVQASNLPEGITPSQAQALSTIYTYGSLPQKDIASNLNCTGGNITMVLDNLEKVDLVKRERSKEDRRNVLVSLTDEGKKVARKVDKAREKGIEEFFAGCQGYEQDTIETFSDVLLTLVKG